MPPEQNPGNHSNSSRATVNTNRMRSSNHENRCGWKAIGQPTRDLWNEHRCRIAVKQFDKHNRTEIQPNPTAECQPRQTRMQAVQGTLAECGRTANNQPDPELTEHWAQARGASSATGTVGRNHRGGKQVGVCSIAYGLQSTQSSCNNAVGYCLQ